jgi:hypothetical protein
MKIRTFNYTVLVDEHGVRVRCVFCGDVLFARQERVEAHDVPDFSEGLNNHACFQEGAIPPCPQVRA